MGLLDEIMGGGQPQRRPGLGSTIAAGVVLALLVKGVRQYQASHGGTPGERRSFDPIAPGTEPPVQAGAGPGGLLGGLGGLGGLMGSGGLGGLLGSLGGAGAMGSLVNRFREAGFDQQVGSWVGGGPNQSIAPHEVGAVLGDDVITELQQKSGLPRDQLLAELARELPQAINQATPQGRLPQTDEELHQVAQQPGASG